MIGWLATLTGLGRAAVVALIVASLLALAGLGSWGAISGISSYLATVAKTASDARDLHWRLQMAEANLAVQAARTEQALAVSRIEAIAAEENRALRDRVSELEKANADLAGFDDGGIDHGRVRLLNRSAAGGADRAR